MANEIASPHLAVGTLRLSSAQALRISHAGVSRIETVYAIEGRAASQLYQGAASGDLSADRIWNIRRDPRRGQS